MQLEMPLHDPVLQFTVLVLTALLARLLIQRVHVPGLIGLLLAGMLLGPGGIHLLPRGEIIELLGSVGLVYIMFQAGLEIDLDIVARRQRETLSFGMLTFFCSLLPAVAAGIWLLGYRWDAALMLGTLLSSHTLVAYPIVARLDLLDRPAVVTAIGGTLITDTLALILLVTVLQLAAEHDPLGLGIWWLPLALLAALTAISLWAVPHVSRRFLAHPELRRAERALFALAVVMLLASVVEVIGAEKILGAFLAGICLNQPLKESEELLEHLEFAGRMLFIPFFFIETGMRLDLQVFSQGGTWLLAMLLVFLVLVGKTAGAWLTGYLFGFSRRSRLLMIGLTVPQAAATLAVTVSARRVDIFDEQTVDAVIILIFVTCMAGPLLVRLTGRQLRETATGAT